MKMNQKFLLGGMLILLLMAVMGCSPGQPTEEVVTEIPEETELATLPPTVAPTATDEIQESVDEPTDEPEQTEDTSSEDAMSTDQDGACVECHTDKAMLIDTADPVEEVESENEGAG